MLLSHCTYLKGDLRMFFGAGSVILIGIIGVLRVVRLVKGVVML